MSSQRRSSHTWGNRGRFHWYADNHRFAFRWMRDLYMRLAWGKDHWERSKRHEAANRAAWEQMQKATSE